MQTDAPALTKQGIARHQAGDLPGAAGFFTQAVEAEPTYEMAWLWLSSCLGAPGEKRYCLEHALLANPQSAPARKGLDMLGDVATVRPAALGHPFSHRQTVRDALQAAPPTPAALRDALKSAPPAIAVSLPALRDALKPATAGVAPAKKRIPNALIIALVGIVILVIVWIGVGFVSSVTPQKIGYRISGTTGNVDVTLTNASGGTEQRNIAPPYELNFDAKSGQSLYISGQNQWDAGVVTCQILINGQIAQTASSNASFGIATCSGRL